MSWSGPTINGKVSQHIFSNPDDENQTLFENFIPFLRPYHTATQNYRQKLLSERPMKTFHVEPWA
jgi:hypothetical protein